MTPRGCLQAVVEQFTFPKKVATLGVAPPSST
jgi:hypothetical protein